MGKLAYHDALDFRLRELTERIATLKLRLEHAVGAEKFQTYCEVQRLEGRKRILGDRLHKLESAKSGLWHDIKADIHGFIDELPGIAEQWIELLDAGYASLSRETRYQPTAAPEWVGESFVREATRDRASHSHREHRDGEHVKEKAHG
jgi:hypothetical protein